MASSNMAFTQIDVKKTQFTWKIDNFSCLSKFMSTEHCLASPTFTVKPDDSVKWQLFLYPNGFNSNYSAFLSISLNCSYASGINVQVKIAPSAVDNKGRKCFEQIKEKSMFATSANQSREDFLTFIPKNLLAFENNGILLNDVLTVCCDLSVVYKYSIENVGESIQQSPTQLANKVLNAFEQQFEKQEFSDVKLVASCGKVLRAHKFILAARSPVFSAMFTNDMKEKNDHSVVIEDLDYDTLKEMLRFMYAGRVENLDKTAAGVLQAQEKYEIDGLKELCEEYFFRNISVENMIEALALSIRYNMDKINLLAKKFIRFHAKDVSNNTTFKATDEPGLLAEIVNILSDIS